MSGEHIEGPASSSGSDISSSSGSESSDHDDTGVPDLLVDVATNVGQNTNTDDDDDKFSDAQSFIDDQQKDEPTKDEPTKDEPATDEPATDKPATDKPATDKPAAENDDKPLEGLIVSSGPDDLTALLNSLTAPIKFGLPEKPKAIEDDPHKDATATVVDPEQSKIFVPLASPKSDEARAYCGQEPFAWAQLVTEHNGQEYVLPKRALKSWRGANVTFTVIDSPLRHAIKLTFSVENPAGGSKLPLDLCAHAFFFFGHTIAKEKQIQNLMITDVLKHDYRPPAEPTLQQLEEADDGHTTLPPSGPMDDDIAAIDIQWASCGATCVLFNSYNSNWSTETKALMALGESLRNPGTVHLRLPVHTKEKRNQLAELRKMVAWSPNGPIPEKCDALPPLWPYHRKSGLPEITFNNMLSAETLTSATPAFTPIPIPAELYFIDPREAEVKLGYGAHYEAEYQQEILKLVSDSDHRIGFISLGDIQFATLRINKENLPSRYGENYQIRADEIEIALRIDDLGKEFVMRLMIIDNVFDINLGDADVLGVVQGRRVPREIFKEIASVQPETPSKFFPGKLLYQNNEASTKRQIDAIHLICSNEFDRWRPILLNHSPRLPKVKVIRDCDEKVLADAQSWAKSQLRHREQMNVIDGANDVHGSVGLVSGPPGTGKTLTAAHLSVLYSKTGGHVIYMAPTQQSCDHALGVIKDIAPEIPVIRVYRSAHEEGEQRTAKSANELADDIDIENQILEISIIMAMRKEKRDKLFGHPQHSLARTMINRALSCRDGKVLEEYKPKGSDPKKPGEMVDFWAEIRRCTASLEDPENPYHSWSSEEKAKYSFCCKHGSNAVMKDAKFIIVTANNVGAKVITKNFGLEAKFIAVVCDEAAMVTESDQWIALTKLTANKKITVLWLIGDHKQLVPLIISRFAAINPFGWQLEFSLYARLIVAGHAHYELHLSNRMHRDILRFPNKRSYGGRLQATTAANCRELPKAYLKWFKQYFNEQKDDNCRLYSILVEGECVVVPKGGSKYNVENAATIVQMVNSMREAGAFPADKIAILSMYGRQKVVISAMFKALAAKLNLPRTAFPEVMTVDSFQSNERTMIILDSTVTDDLGFVDNENRMTMACTRARDVFVLVGSKATMVKSLGIDDEEGKIFSPDQYTIQHRRVNDVGGVRYFHSSSYLADYLSYLSRVNRAYQPTHSNAILQSNFGVTLNFITEGDDQGDIQNEDQGDIENEDQGDDDQGNGAGDEWLWGTTGGGEWNTDDNGEWNPDGNSGGDGTQNVNW